MEREVADTGVRGQRQVGAVGCGARGTGCFLRVAGFFAAMGGAGHLRAPSVYDYGNPGNAIWTGLLMIAGGMAAVVAGSRLARHGRRHTARVLERPEELPDRRFTLYLRPFDVDHALNRVMQAPRASLRERVTHTSGRTFEEALARGLRRRFGRVVAVGKPGERLPLPGADRFYLPLAEWQAPVSALIGRARVVALVTGSSAGTLWELTECMRLLPPERLLLLVFSDEVEYEEFRAAVPAAFEERSRELVGEGSVGEGSVPLRTPVFPAYPPLHNPQSLVRGTGLQGLIHFDAAWQPTFTRCDYTRFWTLTLMGRQMKMERRMVRPVLRRLAEATVEGAAEGAAEGADGRGRIAPLA
ncbi:hypothetical protein OG866_12840 [Streptomyces sp. NBC_00663]|uniref:hypothetical protein n=1 Tax=Streptomyces sp. NBC_00663 TaxID=2975801 RepID=UPI002E325807|nr:hypothetical protein [Streptomyces sp. NBC_00663]